MPISLYSIKRLELQKSFCVILSLSRSVSSRNAFRFEDGGSEEREIERKRKPI